MSTFWSGWIIAIVLINLFGCLMLLWWTRQDTGDVPMGQSMGHAFDGIEEINNPMPHWWLNLFYFTIAFAFIYLALYPGFGSFKGMLGWTSTGQWELEVEKANNRYDAIFAEYAKVPVEELAKDSEAIQIGQRLFGNNCAVCHGSDARGAIGFPNLTDKDWLYGGTPEKITETVTGGRQSIGMPAFAEQVGEDGVKNLAAYVVSLSGRQPTVGNAAEGQQLFTAKGCIACHGPEAKGMEMMGAPNLTDNVWLYGGTEDAVMATIAKGRKGVMPTFKDQLGNDKIHVIATYIYSLSQ